ncbi:MAG: L,D-transpeptidase [Candidatus Saganbacteria bacterium]|nr:L,D-transpeptidase [Candidatus Saganbacteria bacterium]
MFAEEKTAYESIKIFNSTNFAAYSNRYLGYQYASHGCLHFYPADIYLLTQTIPVGTPISIKPYTGIEAELQFDPQKVPYLVGITSNFSDIEKHKKAFKAQKPEIVFYPALNKLLILTNGTPYAQMEVLAGQPYDFLMPLFVSSGQPIEWDTMLSTPTDPGSYTVWGTTDHYISNAYYANTIVPFGALITKKNGTWVYQEKDKWYTLPKNVLDDILLPASDRQYNYYDIEVDAKGKIESLCYAGHDFGKYVLLWTADGKNRYPEMGYAAGQLLYEQVALVKDLAQILTLPGSDDFDACVSQNKDFAVYKGFYDFVSSEGKIVPRDVPSEVTAYYRLYKGWQLSDIDNQNIDPRILKALDEYQHNRLPRNEEAREKEMGLYYYLELIGLLVDKEANWYGKLKADWDFWKNLRVKLRGDFDKMGILSAENRRNIVEGWLNSRLEFDVVTPPVQAKNLQDLSFSSFFRPEESTNLFTEREKEIMRDVLRKAASGEGQGIYFYSVDALNNYNFGLLLNDILGDLYKSHGCLHVSPRNSLFLSAMLPVGSKMTIHDYSDKVSEEVLSQTPNLADLVNFNEDFDNLSKQFTVTSEVRVEVYPVSGYWIVYLKEKPFAKLQVVGGPQAKMYMLQGRDDLGKPNFQDNLAYPSTPGNYSVFDKVQNYVSNIYYDTTIIPMGGVIRKAGDGYQFQDKNGSWEALSKMVEEDLRQPQDKRQYTYYDNVFDPNGVEIEVKWGSHPFGKYAIRTTVDGKTPFPELIHSSGDLIMEERQLVNDLIKILSAPYDNLDDCIKGDPNFELYKTCYDFVQDPNREDLIQVKERANYKLYNNLPLSTGEASALPKDSVIAHKLLSGKELTEDEINVLVSEDIAYRRGQKIKINMEKILGLEFDVYQYGVMIQKYAHHYQILKEKWPELTELRKAMLKDFNNFVVKDPQVLSKFMRELMLERVQLQRVSQPEALQLLNNILN